MYLQYWYYSLGGCALALDSAPQLTRASQLGPGIPAAPRNYYLPLLPLRPDGFHSALPRRTRPSTPLSLSSPTGKEPQLRNQPC
jgi:hypothetical protein